MKHRSPQIRRLQSDHQKLESLTSQSTILRFKSQGDPPTQYLIEFNGQSLVRDRGKIAVSNRHEVSVKLGVSYPRAIPELRWLTPIYHPNISEVGLICLGGYGTHWAPSLHLDELCVMLWDMARYHNYDIRSPYNREAALWAANQTAIRFPVDPRPLRDLRAAVGRLDTEFVVSTPTATVPPPPLVPKLPIEPDRSPPLKAPEPAIAPIDDILFID